MRLIKCEQGTPEWLSARVAIPTGSMFFEARKRLKSGPNKGGFTTAGKQYAFRLACERISGVALDEDGFENYAMRRGHELEPTARLLHEEAKGVLVEQVGFITDDQGLFGVSVDGLVGKNGISEYKCFISPAKLMPILIDGDLSDIMDQVQGGLWITERQWAHFVLYCPALEPVGKHLTIIEVERDEVYIKELESDLLEFKGLVDHYVELLTDQPEAVVEAPELVEEQAAFSF
jgi:hypothetical protein